MKAALLAAAMFGAVVLGTFGAASATISAPTSPSAKAAAASQIDQVKWKKRGHHRHCGWRSHRRHCWWR
jgi:hypothetical protein